MPIRTRRLTWAVAATVAGVGLLTAAYIAPRAPDLSAALGKPAAAVPPTEIGLNLFGLEVYNRQPVFTNLIAQSQWFTSRGSGWKVMPDERMDRFGWIRALQPGETAPRPLMLPAAPYRLMRVRCVFRGQGQLQAGGIAQERESAPGVFTFDLHPTGADDEGAWIELIQTDPADPLRELDCRDVERPRDERLHPEFLAFVKGYTILRFLDWGKVNENRAVTWDTRTLPSSSSQVGTGGASIEDMVDLADATGADPWLLVPYRADDDYTRRFAELVHSRVDPARTVYVELGNEIWNDMFDAAQQARREGMALKLGGGDPTRAQMARYADKLSRVMQIWTEVFADRPGKLVRVAATQNANPELAKHILSHGDTARWVDALATAPYIWHDLKGLGVRDVDAIFAELPRATEKAVSDAAQNRLTAHRYGKRFLSYEGGQHLVTDDLVLARALQRDPRMGMAYTRYMDAWRNRIGSVLVLYASTAPISEYGSWGLREYAGQPLNETPKLQAVRRFMDRQR